MIFWIVVTLLSVALGLALARPLLRGADEAAPRREDFDAAVYRDQLAEIERDRARGTLSDDQATAARLEVERRLLSTANKTGQPAAPSPRASHTPIVAAVVALAVPVLALLTYAELGAPGLPGQPFADRRDRAPGSQSAEGEAHQGAQAESMQVLTERMAKRLAEAGGTAEEWSLLARSYQNLERHRDAVAALERAVSVSNRDPQYVAALGEARIMAADGMVPPQARAEFEEALKRDPKDPRSRFYIALAEAQSGKLHEALDRMVALAKDTPPDAPYLAMVRERIAGLAGELKQDPAKVLAQTPSPTAPKAPLAPPQAASAAAERGPTAQDVAAAQQMSPEARQQMIRGMVDGLAAKLDADPGDIDGWVRLIRAYKVLGEDNKAADAAAKAAAANPAQRMRIAATAQQLGIAVAAPQAQPPAQTASLDAPPLDAKAIRAGSPAPADRVAALRQRLQSAPNDREALFQVGLAEAALGNKLAAAELWGRLLGQFNPASPEYAALRARLDALKGG